MQVAQRLFTNNKAENTVGGGHNPRAATAYFEICRYMSLRARATRDNAIIIGVASHAGRGPLRAAIIYPTAAFPSKMLSRR